MSEPEALGLMLDIDLSRRQVSAEPLAEGLARRYLGGRGLNVHCLQQARAWAADPLGPENTLILSCGLLTGSDAPASSRLHFGARSPLTELLGSSNVGGHFGATLRAAGYQAVRIRGRAEAPACLWIDGNRCEIVEAQDLWGLDSHTAIEKLAARLAVPEAAVMAIGPAGERLVRYACIMTGDGHAAGRTGLGAVMGAKNLKAIALRGQRQARAAAEARSIIREYAESIRNAPRYEAYARYSNSSAINWVNELGILATHNSRQTQFEGAGSIDGTQLIRYVKRSKSCHRCPVHCKAEVRIEQGRYAGLIGERPDIEPIMALGARCGLADPEAVLYLYHLAGRLGIDVISAGGVLAFAMDLFERGILTQEDTGGLPLGWGDAEAMEALMRLIARREGLGNVLAEGVRRAAQIIGRGAEHYAYHSKGMELPGYDPRAALGTALGFAVSNRGADFTSVYPTPEFRWTPEQSREAFGTEHAVDRLSPEGKGALVRQTAIVSAVLDSLGLCKVPALSIVGDFSLEREARLAAALTGWNLTAESLLAAGERIVNAERRFNLSCGLRPEDDDLPDKFVEEAIPSGPTQGRTVDVRPLARDFYKAMGWDEQGRPPEETENGD